MVPQAVLDALNELSATSTDLAAKKADKSVKDQAAAEAAHAAEVAASAVTAAQAELASDKQSLIDLINSTFPAE